MALEDADNPLAIEIRQEMAEAYFGACRKMVAALEALKAFDEKAPSALSNPSSNSRLELLDDAAERVYFLLIQREAMKLSHNEHFLDDYNVPQDVRSRLGSVSSNRTRP